MRRSQNSARKRPVEETLVAKWSRCGLRSNAMDDRTSARRTRSAVRCSARRRLSVQELCWSERESKAGKCKKDEGSRVVHGHNSSSSRSCLMIGSIPATATCTTIWRHRANRSEHATQLPCNTMRGQMHRSARHRAGDCRPAVRDGASREVNASAFMRQLDQLSQMSRSASVPATHRPDHPRAIGQVG
jgi:hypothetical protein